MSRINRAANIGFSINSVKCISRFLKVIHLTLSHSHFTRTTDRCSAEKFLLPELLFIQYIYFNLTKETDESSGKDY